MLPAERDIRAIAVVAGKGVKGFESTRNSAPILIDIDLSRLDSLNSIVSA